jgi:hypothetical protein
MQAMMQMGKLKNPLTEKTEKELEAAQITIEMLDMLKEKTKNNISDDEKKFLDQVIGDLKLNYVEEKNKEESKPAEEVKEEKPVDTPDEETMEEKPSDEPDEEPKKENS